MWDLILNPFITVLTVLYQLFNSSVIAIILFTDCYTSGDISR